MCKSALARYEFISSLSAGIKALFSDLRQHSTHGYTYIAMGCSVKRREAYVHVCEHSDCTELYKLFESSC